MSIFLRFLGWSGLGSLAQTQDTASGLADTWENIGKETGDTSRKVTFQMPGFCPPGDFAEGECSGAPCDVTLGASKAERAAEGAPHLLRKPSTPEVSTPPSTAAHKCFILDPKHFALYFQILVVKSNVKGGGLDPTVSSEEMSSGLWEHLETHGACATLPFTL